jgi:hypothetical protein
VGRGHFLSWTGGNESGSDIRIAPSRIASRESLLCLVEPRIKIRKGAFGRPENLRCFIDSRSLSSRWVFDIINFWPRARRNDLRRRKSRSVRELAGQIRALRRYPNQGRAKTSLNFAQPRARSPAQVSATRTAWPAKTRPDADCEHGIRKCTRDCAEYLRRSLVIGLPQARPRRRLGRERNRSLSHRSARADAGETSSGLGRRWSRYSLDFSRKASWRRSTTETDK